MGSHLSIVNEFSSSSVWFNLRSDGCTLLTAKTSIVFVRASYVAAQSDVSEDDVSKGGGSKAEKEGGWLHDSYYQDVNL